MPLFAEFSPFPGIRTILWHITETASDLLEITQLTPAELAQFSTFRHDLRKRQWLACRALLQAARLPGSPVLVYDVNGKPALSPGNTLISVSHAGAMAVIALSDSGPPGVDIELLRPRIERVRERFLQPDEISSISPAFRLEHLHAMWCGKEALYKIHGSPTVDLRNDIYISPFDYLCSGIQTVKASVTMDGIRTGYTLRYCKVDDYMLVTAFAGTEALR